MGFINKYADIGATYDIQDARINDISGATAGQVLTVQADGSVSAANPASGGSGVFVINAIGDISTASEGIITNFTVDKTWEDVQAAFNTYGSAVILNCMFTSGTGSSAGTYIFPAQPMLIQKNTDGTLREMVFQHILADVDSGVGQITTSYRMVDGVINSSGWVIKLLAGL